MIDVRLRFGVCTDRPITRWQAQCVERLGAVPGVAFDRWVQLPAGRVHRRLGKHAAVLAFAPTPDALGSVSPDAPATRGAEGPEPVHRVDVLLDLSSRGIELPVPWASETWRFGFGASLSRDFDRATLIDNVRGPGVTRVALVSEPSRAVVHEGRLRTVSWWAGRQLETILLDLVDWPAQVARERTAPGFVPRQQFSNSGSRITHGSTDLRRQRLAKLPRPLLEAGAASRRVMELAESVTRHNEWNVGVVQVPIEAMLTAGKEQAVSWLPTRAGHWAADPFGLERDGVLHIFFEGFSRRLDRGSISHVSISRDGIISDPETVLDPGVHASYPFLVEHDGATFMLPETSAAGELVLYEAVSFPLQWRRAATLLSGIRAVDASVIEHDGLWWMFAGIDGSGQNQNLYAWHARDLTGPWTPHKANPVKTDARSARPGGTPFISAGQLYRPSQDGSRRYGGRVVINRLDVLTPATFAERPVKAVGPRRGSPYPHGLHTISAAGDRTLIDGNVLRFAREDFQRQVAAKVRR